MWIWAQPRHMVYGSHFFKSQVTFATWNILWGEECHGMQLPCVLTSEEPLETCWRGSFKCWLKWISGAMRYSSDAVAHLVFTLILILGLKRIDMYDIDVDVQKVLSISILIYYILYMYSRISQAGMISQMFFQQFLASSTPWGISPAHWFPKCVSGLSALIRLGEEGLSTVADFWTIMAGLDMTQLCGDYNKASQGFLSNKQYSHNRK